MRKLCPAAVVALSILFSTLMFGQNTLSLNNYVVVDSERATLTRYSITYSVDLVNQGPALASASATLTSLDTNSFVTVPGQDVVNFKAVPANGKVTSTNTFTILMDRTVAFDFSKLGWAFQTKAATQPPVANAGPNQTAALHSTITLDGSKSTNPSGIGTLTYLWSLTRPPGSTAVITSPTSVMPTFSPDVTGSYLIGLTVSNGSATGSTTITISTGHTPPVANAGPNQTATAGSTVTLNGSGSTDVDGNPFTFAWTLTARPAGSAAVLAGPTTVNPTFVMDKTGSYMAQLIVTDAFSSSAPSTVTINALNSIPVANAGPNQSVKIGSLVQLNGAASTDVDGDPLTYTWAMNSIPAGSAAGFTPNNVHIVNPTFTADVAGQYVVQLTVNDGKVDSAPVTVTISTNTVLAPTANAGPNQTVTGHGSAVQLNGSGTDPQNLPLTFLWSLTNKPAGSTATPSASNIASPTFVADKVGDYLAQLIVNNGSLPSTPSTVKITTSNTQPVANAGASQNVTAGATVTLDGSGSSDADHDTLTYSWTLTTRPAGSAAGLTSANTVNAMFVADLPGTYVAQLIVSDPYTPSNPATVTITAAVTPTITLTPGTLTVGNNMTGTLTVMLSAPAGAGGQIVGLLSNNSSVATVPQNVTVPQGSTGANFIVTATGLGSCTITAGAGGFTLGNATVNVVNPKLTLSIDSNGIVGVGRTANGTITLNVPAPAFGVGVQVSTHPDGSGGDATVPSSAINIAPGATTGSFVITGVTEGTIGVTASSPGYSSSTANLTISKLGAVKLPVNATVAPGQTVAYPVSLVTAAPAGGVTVTLLNSDPSKVTVPATVFIPQGASVPLVTPQVTGLNFGSVTISATATGFLGDSQSLSVTGSLTFLPNSTLTTAVGSTQNLTLTLSAPAPAGLTVNLSSDAPAKATVPPTVTFATGATTAPVPVTGIAAGSATIHASMGSVLADTTAAVTVVNLGSISLPATLTVGTGQSASLTVTLSVAAPSPGVTVTLASDSANANVTTSVVIAAGSKTGTAQVTGVTVGSANITATANGFTSPAPTAVTVNSILSITTTSLPSGVVGTPYSQTIAIAGGTGPFNWQQTAGTLPTNLTFAGGIISGTPNVSVTNTPLTFKVTDSSAAPQSVSVNLTLTVTQGPPFSIVAAGTPQSVKVSTAFAPMSVTVKDAGSNPLSGVTVTFVLTPNGNGAGGTFAGGVTTASTNASGVATMPVFTSNGTLGSYTITASVAGLATTAPFALTNIAGDPASIAPSGTPQSVKINTAYAPLSVTVKDSGGNPLSGVSVNFAITAGGSGASGAFAGGILATTNASGVATASTLTANGTVGSFTVTASVTGLGSTAIFTLTNLVGDPATLTPSGTPQSIAINTAFAPMSVTVKDAGGNVVNGATVTFTVNPAAGGAAGTFAGGANTALSNNSGVATATTFTANSTAGSYTVTVAVNGFPAATATFALTNVAGGAGSVTPSGTPQSAKINTNFSPLSVTVKDAGSNPLNGVPVSFTITPAGNGASGTFAGNAVTASVNTNASGVATAPTFTANGTVGSYTVTANASGITGTFALTNTAGDPATITPSGTPQSAAINTAFAPMTVTVKDSGNNPLSGATVTIAITPNGNGATGALAGGVTTAVTNPSGVATLPTLTANGTVGAYTLSVSAGAAPPATFNLTNTQGAPATITPSGTPQSVKISTTFAALSVTVKDAGGNAVAGVPVTFTVTPAGNGASGSFAGAVNTATTNAAGVATPVAFTANSTAGAYTIAATAGAAPAAVFNLTNLPGDPANITAGTGGGQSGVINTVFANPLVVTVKDAGNNPVPNVSVSFTGPASGAGIVATSAITSASGIASAPVTANGTAGGPYTVSASIGGISATFSLTNTGAPTIAATSGSGQSATASTTFAAPLVATVKDSLGNGLSGVTVTFTGTGIALAQAITNGSGVATAAVAANATVGTYTVTASASGISPSATYSLTNTQPCSPCSNITIGSVSVGQNLQTPITIALSAPAPAGGLQLTLTSADPNKILIAGRTTDVGADHIVLGVNAGNSFVGAYLQGGDPSTATLGAVTLTASASGYSNGTGTATLTPSGFVISGPGGLGGAFSANQGVNATLNVSSARLDNSLNYVEIQALRGGFSANVDVTSSTTSVGVISTSPVAFTGGVDTVQTQFVPQNAGSTTITTGVPPGVSIPANDRTLVATVTALSMAVAQTSNTIGNNLQTDAAVVLTGAASGSGLAVTISTLDPKIQFSNNAAGCSIGVCGGATGTSTLNLTIPAGRTQSQTFFIQGLAASGNASYTVMATGYPTVTASVTLAPSGFVMAGPGGFGAGINFGLATTLTISSAQLDNSNAFAAFQPIRGGISATVNVNNSNPATGSVSPPSVTIANGASNATTQFNPSSSGGSGTLTAVTPAPFTTPTNDTTVSVTIQPRTMTLTGNSGDGPIMIGKDLQVQGSVTLNTVAPAGGLTVTLTSNDASSLILSASATGVGTGTLMVTIPGGSNTVSYFLQALKGTGLIGYTGTASQFPNAAGTASLSPSGLILTGPGPQDVLLAGTGSPETLTVSAVPLNSDRTVPSGVTPQDIRGGVSASVSMSITGQPTNTLSGLPVTIVAGSGGSGSVVFTPAQSGSTSIQLINATGIALAGQHTSKTGNVF